MGKNKMLMRICGFTPLELSLKAMERSCVTDIIIVTSASTYEAALSLPCSKPKKAVMGGKTRGESVHNALLMCDRDTDIAVIHDGARCLVTEDIINTSIEHAAIHGSATAVVKMRDTVRKLNGSTVPRDDLLLMQTPQTFKYKLILEAYEKLTAECTDDCGALAALGHTPHYFEASIENQKLTTPDDIPFFEAIIRGRYDNMRIGYGEDTHRLCEGRKLVLGGVNIDFHLGLLGHSDADVLCHAVSDALLGACALGDIGVHFPDTDPAYEGANSIELLRSVAEKLMNAGYEPVNTDATIIAQEPKLAPHITAMRENIASALNTDIANISIKATTPEHTGPEGNLECITVRAVAQVLKRR